jgi:hypothetical protein
LNKSPAAIEEFAAVAKLCVKLKELGKTEQMYDLLSATLALKSGPEYVPVVRSVSHQIELRIQSQGGSIAARLRRRMGDNPISPTIFGLCFSLACVTAVFFGWPLIARLGTSNGLDPFMKMEEVGNLTVAATLGAATSIFVRISELSAVRYHDPIVLFLNALFKPVIAIIFSIIVYSLLKSGLVTVTGIALSGDETHIKYTVWILGFVCGFSERFATDLIGRVDRPSAGGGGQAAPQGGASGSS